MGLEITIWVPRMLIPAELVIVSRPFLWLKLPNKLCLKKKESRVHVTLKNQIKWPRDFSSLMFHLYLLSSTLKKTPVLDNINMIIHFLLLKETKSKIVSEWWYQLYHQQYDYWKKLMSFCDRS